MSSLFAVCIVPGTVADDVWYVCTSNNRSQAFLEALRTVLSNSRSTADLSCRASFTLLFCLYKQNSLAQPDFAKCLLLVCSSKLRSHYTATVRYIEHILGIIDDMQGFQKSCAPIRAKELAKTKTCAAITVTSHWKGL